jgi:hypothetical protein
MTRNPIIHKLALPIALLGLATCKDSEGAENSWSTWSGTGGESERDGEHDDNGDEEQGNDGDEDNGDADDGNGNADDAGEGGGDGDGDGDGGGGAGDGDGGDGDGGDGDSGDGDGGDGDGDPFSGKSTEPNLRVAFIGDQGTTNDSEAVLNLVKDEGAAFLVIAGDFDYDDNPDAWDDQTNDTLGADYPIFAVAGNHDKDAWDGQDGYQSKVIARQQNAIDDGATCTGEPGQNSACSYKGLFLAMSGVDVFEGQDESADYLRSELAGNDAIWSVCVWHKNMTDMQAGDKPNETGWGVYQACQDEAGIVITGHEHSYARTLTLTALGNESEEHGAVGEPQQMDVSEGSTFVSVVGLGGRNIREYDGNEHDDDTWWASLYTTNHYLNNGEIVDDFDAKAGALFIDFNVDGDPNKAHAYFKNIDGEIIDEYDIFR